MQLRELANILTNMSQDISLSYNIQVTYIVDEALQLLRSRFADVGVDVNYYIIPLNNNPMGNINLNPMMMGMNPMLMGGMPMGMGMNPMMGGMGMQQMPMQQQAPLQQTPMIQQQYPTPPQAVPQPISAPKPTPPPPSNTGMVTPTTPSKSSPIAAGPLPGMGGGNDESAAGRDYLLSVINGTA